MIIMHKLLKGENELKLRTKEPQLASALSAATDQLSISHRFLLSTYCLHSTRLRKKRCKRPVPGLQEAKAIRLAHRKLINAVGM